MNSNFGGRIGYFREKHNMTQAELAKRIGGSKAMVSAYETDIRKPSYDVLMRIALFFNVSMDFSPIRMNRRRAP